MASSLISSYVHSNPVFSETRPKFLAPHYGRLLADLPPVWPAPELAAYVAAKNAEFGADIVTLYSTEDSHFVVSVRGRRKFAVIYMLADRNAEVWWHPVDETFSETAPLLAAIERQLAPLIRRALR